MNSLVPVRFFSSGAPPARPAEARPARRTTASSPLGTTRGPIRVGFVVHKMQVAGAEVLVRETIHRLGTRIEPTVFCLDAIGQIGEELRAAGVPVVCLNRRPGRDYGVAWRLAREARRRRVQIVHAHQYTPFFYAALARALSVNGFRLILTEHGRHYPDVVAPVRRGLNRLVLSQFADAINACCDFSARALSRIDGFPGHRIEVIENGIDPEPYAASRSRPEVRERLGLAADRRYVVTIARFHPVKDHPTLLKAFAEAARARPDVDLLLAGDGPTRPDLERLAADLGIADRVRFLGIRRDVPDLLLAADVFALTSVSEAASLTLMEAMAAGRPVVITNVGGNPELVRDGTDGYLFPRGDHVAGARALLRMLDDPAFAAACGQSARDRALERFSLTRTVDRYHALYRRLTGRGGGR
jgi:L-malate glycosyltransferase